MKFDIWLEDPEQLARKLTKDDFKRVKKLPEKTVCLASFKDGSEKVFTSPHELSSKWDAETILFKSNDILLPFTFERLSSKEGLSYQASFILHLYLEANSKNALIDFAELFTRTQGNCEKKDLFSFLKEEVKAGLKRFFLIHTADSLLKEKIEDELFQDIKESLQSKCRQSGLSVLQLSQVNFESTDFQKIQDEKKQRLLQEESLKTEQEKIKAQQELALLKEEKDKEKALKRQQWLRELAEQDRSHRSEQEQKEFEEQLARTKRALEEFQGVKVESLIAQLTEPKERYSLLKLLIEKDMSPEQLEARLPSNLEALDQKIEKLQELVMKVTSEESIKIPPPSTQLSTYRILVASGNKILCFNPQSRRHKPSIEYSFGDELGWIRSIGLERIEGEHYLFAGAVHGVYQKKLNSSLPIEHFAFPKKTNGRNGCNSVAFMKDYLYSTHSEQHLWRWHQKQYGEPEPLLAKPLKQNKNVRGITAYGEKLYFAGETAIYQFDPLKPTEIEREYRISNTVTCFLIFEAKLYVGDQEGGIYVFDLDHADEGELLSRFPHSIYMMKLAFLQNLPHLLLGNKQYGVLALSLKSLSQTLFQTDQPLRWVDGNHDFLFGVDTRGNHLYIWDSNDPKKALEKIYVNATIQDLYLWKK